MILGTCVALHHVASKLVTSLDRLNFYSSFGCNMSTNMLVYFIQQIVSAKDEMNDEGLIEVVRNFLSVWNVPVNLDNFWRMHLV